MYQSPSIEVVGAFGDLTELRIHKSTGKGDVIILAGETINVPNGGLITFTS